MVSVDQESRHGLARSQLRVKVRLHSHLEAQLGGSPSKLPQVYGRIHFFVAVEVMVACFFKARSLSYLQSLTSGKAQSLL